MKALNGVNFQATISEKTFICIQVSICIHLHKQLSAMEKKKTPSKENVKTKDTN